MTTAMHFRGRASLPAAGLDMRVLVAANGYDVRRVLVGPGERHGPGRYGGDALVCLLGGTLTFTVDGRTHALSPGFDLETV